MSDYSSGSATATAATAASAEPAPNPLPSWFNPYTARTVHACFACLAYALFFPSGAISIRILPGRIAYWTHLGFQFFALTLSTVSVGLGIYLALTYHTLEMYHPTIGLTVWCFMMLQPLSGWLHHVFFKKYMTRTTFSEMHVALGRAFVTIGIINGGLGMMLAENETTATITVYSVLAGLIWIAWAVVAVRSDYSKHKKTIDEARTRLLNNGNHHHSGSDHASDTYSETKPNTSAA